MEEAPGVTAANYWNPLRMPVFEASFSSKNAGTFMKGQGYEFLPATYMFHKDITTTTFPDAQGPAAITQTMDNSSIQSVLTRQYVPWYHSVRSTEVLSSYKEPLGNIASYFPFGYRSQSWIINRDVYRGGYNTDKTFKTMKDVGTQLDIWGDVGELLYKLLNFKKK